MTLIKTRLISPKECFERKKRKELLLSQQVLLKWCNTYMEEVAKNTPGTLDTTYAYCERGWVSFAAKWNADQNKLIELRPSDFDAFMTFHLEKLKNDGKNKFWKTYGNILRPLLDRIRLRSNERKDTTE